MNTVSKCGKCAAKTKKHKNTNTFFYAFINISALH
jgi:hypothetical protein